MLSKKKENFFLTLQKAYENFMLDKEGDNYLLLNIGVEAFQ